MVNSDKENFNEEEELVSKLELTPLNSFHLKIKYLIRKKVSIPKIKMISFFI